jgi:hypothetical protein
MRRRCIGCAVGAEHELGREPERWPDGSPVVRLELSSKAIPAPERLCTVVPTVAGPLARPRPAKAAKRRAEARSRVPADPVGRRRGAEYEWRGHRGGLWQLAQLPEVAALGISPSMASNRVRCRGWSIDAALSTPPRPPPRPIYRGPAYEWRGRTMTIAELHETPEAKALGISRKALWMRLSELQWDTERALATPVRQWGRRG